MLERLRVAGQKDGGHIVPIKVFGEQIVEESGVGRDVAGDQQIAPDTVEKSGVVNTTAHYTAHCVQAVALVLEHLFVVMEHKRLPPLAFRYTSAS